MTNNMTQTNNEREAVAVLNSIWGSDTGWQYNIKLLPSFETDKYLESIDGHDIYLYLSPPKQIPDGWKLISDELPISGIRVLIFTDGVDFNGEQYFDVQSDSLNECFYENRDDMPEVCIHATHWMPLPEAPTTSETNTEVGE